MTTSFDENLPTTFEEAASSAEIIVKGRFGNEVDTINALRDSDDPTQEAENSHLDGHIYEFAIGELYKGELEYDIQILLSSARLITVRSENGNDVGEVMVPEIDWEEPDPKKDYLLFLSQTDLENTIYARSSSAGIIEVNDDGELRIVSNRVEGEEGDNIEIENGTAIMYTEIREDINVDYQEEGPTIENFVEYMNIEDAEYHSKIE